MEKIKCYCGHTDYCDCAPEKQPDTTSKTAVQEFIDEMKSHGSWIPKYVQDKYLKKEREQMISFYRWMLANDKPEYAERFFHYTDDDMINEFLTKTK